MDPVQTAVRFRLRFPENLYSVLFLRKSPVYHLRLQYLYPALPLPSPGLGRSLCRTNTGSSCQYCHSLGSKDHSCCHKDRKNPAFHFSHSLLLLTEYSFTQHHVFFIINVAFKFFQSLCHAFVIPALHLFVFLVETLPHFISQNKIISGCTADIA